MQSMNDRTTFGLILFFLQGDRQKLMFPSVHVSSMFRFAFFFDGTITEQRRDKKDHREWQK